MAPGTAVGPESGTYQLTGTAGLGGTPYGHDQITAEDPGHHRPLHTLHLEAKFRKLRQHVLPPHEAQMGEECRANDRTAAQRIAKGIEVAQRQFRTFHAAD